MSATDTPLRAIVGLVDEADGRRRHVSDTEIRTGVHHSLIALLGRTNDDGELASNTDSIGLLEKFFFFVATYELLTKTYTTLTRVSCC